MKRQSITSATVLLLFLLSFVSLCRGSEFPAPVVDKAAASITIPGEIAEQGIYDVLKGCIEYVACCPDGKTYEALLICKVKPQDLYNALVEVGVKPGTPAEEGEDETSSLPQGDTVDIAMEWEVAGQKRREPIEAFMLDTKTDKPMPDVEWVFVGSRQGVDPDTGEEVLQADMVGNLIALHHRDATVLIQNPLEAGRDFNRYKTNMQILPPKGTPIKLVLQGKIKKAEQTEDPSDLRYVHAFVSGKLKGVGFKSYVQRQARKFKVKGWVQDSKDGRIEIAAAGSKPNIDKFLEFVKKGPRGSAVEGVDLQESSEKGPYSSFEIR